MDDPATNLAIILIILMLVIAALVSVIQNMFFKIQKLRVDVEKQFKLISLQRNINLATEEQIKTLTDALKSLE